MELVKEEVVTAHKENMDSSVSASETSENVFPLFLFHPLLLLEYVVTCSIYLVQCEIKLQTKNIY